MDPLVPARPTHPDSVPSGPERRGRVRATCTTLCALSECSRRVPTRSELLVMTKVRSGLSLRLCTFVGLSSNNIGDVGMQIFTLQRRDISDYLVRPETNPGAPSRCTEECV